MVPRDREVAPVVVELDLPVLTETDLAADAPTVRQRAEGEEAEPGPARGDLGVRLEPLDDRARPDRDHAALPMSAVVEVDADDGIVPVEDVAKAVEIGGAEIGRHRRVERRPGRRIVRGGFRRGRSRLVGNLRPLRVDELGPPAHPARDRPEARRDLVGLDVEPGRPRRGGHDGVIARSGSSGSESSGNMTSRRSASGFSSSARRGGARGLATGSPITRRRVVERRAEARARVRGGYDRSRGGRRV